MWLLILVGAQALIRPMHPNDWHMQVTPIMTHHCKWERKYIEPLYIISENFM